METNKIKHLEMIEKIIERMAKNSTNLKQWTMGLVSIICAFGTGDSNISFILVALVPIICFWLLDSYYLQLERKYKVLYKRAAVQPVDNVDFNLSTGNLVYDSNEAKRICYYSCLFSFTEIIFYLPLTIAVCGIVVWVVTTVSVT